VGKFVLDQLLKDTHYSTLTCRITYHCSRQMRSKCVVITAVKPLAIFRPQWFC